MSIINLGMVYKPSPAELEDLSASLAEAAGARPVEEKVQGLAGPNDILQLVIDAVNWKTALEVLGVFLGGRFLKSFADELGKQAGASLWKNKKHYYEAVKSTASSALRQFTDSIRAIRAKDQVVAVAIKIPGSGRNAGLVLTSDDDAELLWQIANVYRCAVEIAAIIEPMVGDPVAMQKSGTIAVSVRVEVLENGDVRVFDQTIAKD
jgi:hypothetical protein